jgi:hypothetical protein
MFKFSLDCVKMLAITKTICSECYLVGCNAAWSGTSPLTFWGMYWLHLQRKKPSKKPVSRALLASYFFLVSCCLTWKWKQYILLKHRWASTRLHALTLCLLPAVCWFHACFSLWSWRWGQYLLETYCGLLLSYTVLQSQKKPVFIATAVRTSHPTRQLMLCIFSDFVH